jgi:hypothetical protein
VPLMRTSGAGPSSAPPAPVESAGGSPISAMFPAKSQQPRPSDWRRQAAGSRGAGRQVDRKAHLTSLRPFPDGIGYQGFREVQPRRLWVLETSSRNSSGGWALQSSQQRASWYSSCPAGTMKLPEPLRR